MRWFLLFGLLCGSDVRAVTDGDADHDRIPDSVDKCPTEPETYNGYEDEDGCPDRAIPKVSGTCSLSVGDHIDFAYGKATVRRASRPILLAVAQTIIGNQQLLRIAVHGIVSTDEQPRLARVRADAIVHELVGMGVPVARLVAIGDTKPGRRVVSFEILERAQ